MAWVKLCLKTHLQIAGVRSNAATLVTLGLGGDVVGGWWWVRVVGGGKVGEVRAWAS